jgi:KipI family sensor histidine kinase inhibitor
VSEGNAAVNVSIESAGDRSLIVRLRQEISVEVHEWVRRLFLALRQSPPAGVINLHPAYASLLVDFNPLSTDFAAVAENIRMLLVDLRCMPAFQPRQIEIPVCYGGEFGPDIEDVAAHCGMSPDDVISRHAANEYLVYFIGFSPGFPYLGGLDPALAVPRVATPRTHVPAGSIAIGGAQTGIYPMASPGGWRIIGRTPQQLFDPARPPYALLAMGDRVRFRPIPAHEFPA